MGRGLLDGRTAIITGAGQGLGRAIAQEFSAEGAAVALLEINTSTLAEAESELRAKGYTALAYPLDISDYQAYQKVIEDIARQWEHIDILVNNAATHGFYGTILGERGDSLETWRFTQAVNLESVYTGAKLVVPHMVKQQYGRIINISSVQGFTSSGECGAYNASKGGIIAFTKSLAVELSPYNILVNAVAPGFIRTPMSVVNGVDETTTPDFLEWYGKRRKIPLGRAGLPEEVSGTVVFLASEYCRYMTGQVLVVDGGLTTTF